MSPKNLSAIKTLKNFQLKLYNKKIQSLFNLFEKNFQINKSFVVGVSGGPDSLALAFLTKVYSIKNNLRCKYVIVDHKLRKGSTEEANQVKKILSSHNIKAEILTWKGKKPLKNIQSLARKKRYELLISKCEKLKIFNLIVGHHLDDLFENFFIRMIRGSGLKGLVSLQKETKFSSINLVRPLLNFKKKDLEYISSCVFNFYVKDPSNNNTIFQRIKIRNIINEFQKNGLNKDKLFLTINNLKKADQALLFYVEQNKKLNSFFHKEKKEILLNLNFFNQPHEIVFRSFSDFLKIIGEKYNFARGKKVEGIIYRIQKNTFKKETLAGCIVKKVNHTVIITKEY
tara:strand:- start:733 stop:1758 length:1026 start_codon:yes stop_codon:yes gene_type:complete